MEEMDKSSIKKTLEETKSMIMQSGSTVGEKAEQLFLRMLVQSLTAYDKNANKEYFSKKYPGKSKEFIEDKIIKLAVSNSGILGGVAGAMISTQEIGGMIGFPVTGPIALTTGIASVLAEMGILVKLQLSMILKLADLHDFNIDKEDPEDVIFLIYCLVRAGVQDTLRVPIMKKGTQLSVEFTQKVIAKELPILLRKLGIKVGSKMIQRSFAKYVLPGLSIVIGSLWNRQSTKAIANYTLDYIKKRKEELVNDTEVVPV